MKRGKVSRRNSRASAVEVRDVRKREFLAVAREEEQYEKQQPVPKLEPKNQNQKTAIAYLNSGKPVVFLIGSAGTGKSLLAAFRAATLLKQKRVDKVYLVRPAVSVGKSVGLLPGDIKEKLAPYFAQTMTHLEKFLGAGFMKYCLEKEVIEMKPVEYLRGMSFENCMVIAEEVQNFTADEMEMMLTRIGEGCTIVFTGDQKQHDLRGISGLEETVKLLDHITMSHPSYLSHSDIDEIDDGIGIVRFTPEDVIRSGLTRAFVKMYYHNGKAA